MANNAPKIKEIPFQPSTVETVDFAVYSWLNETMDIFSTTNKGREKVPVIWSSAERAYQIKNNKELRDQEGTLLLPLITVERTSVVKDPAFKGPVQAHVYSANDYRGGALPAARKLNHDRTLEFANNDSRRRYGNKRVGNDQINFKTKKKNKKIVYNTYYSALPVYVTLMYNINIKSNYQQQMNEMLQPFITKTGGINYFVVDHEKHRYEAFMQQDFSQDNNVSSLAEEERRYETKFDIKVLGYLMGQDTNDTQPKFAVRENAVEIRFPRERVVFDDLIEHTDLLKEYKR